MGWKERRKKEREREAGECKWCWNSYFSCCKKTHNIKKMEGGSPPKRTQVEEKEDGDGGKKPLNKKFIPKFKSSKMKNSVLFFCKPMKKVRELGGGTKRSPLFHPEKLQFLVLFVGNLGKGKRGTKLKGIQWKRNHHCHYGIPMAGAGREGEKRSVFTPLMGKPLKIRQRSSLPPSLSLSHFRNKKVEKKFFDHWSPKK